MAASESTREHRKAAAREGPVAVAVVTVSDTRTAETDGSGRFLIEELERCGHRLSAYRLVPDDPEAVGLLLDDLASSEARVILFNGGTGIAPRDNTYDVLSRRLEKTLPGFGELFRMLSYQEIGAAALLSRATAGVYRGRVVISMPGSPHAVKLAWERLIEPELQHLVWEVARNS